MGRIQDYFSSYGATLACGIADKNAVVLTTYDPEWIETYFNSKFDRIDPIFKFAANYARSSGSHLLSEADMASPLFEEARPYEAASNAMATSHFGGSTFIIGGTNPELESRHLAEIEETIQGEHRGLLLAKVAELTDAQIDMMDEFDAGSTEIEVAHELGISISAVAQRKKAVCTKLGLRNFNAASKIYTLSKWGHIVKAN